MFIAGRMALSLLGQSSLKRTKAGYSKQTRFAVVIDGCKHSGHGIATVMSKDGCLGRSLPSSWQAKGYVAGISRAYRYLSQLVQEQITHPAAGPLKTYQLPFG